MDPARRTKEPGTGIGESTVPWNSATASAGRKRSLKLVKAAKVFVSSSAREDTPWAQSSSRAFPDGLVVVWRGNAEVAVHRCRAARAGVLWHGQVACRALVVGPCSGLAVGLAGFQAAVQDAGQAAGDAAERLIVPGAACAHRRSTCGRRGRRFMRPAPGRAARWPGACCGSSGRARFSSCPIRWSAGGAAVVLAGLGGGVPAGASPNSPRAPGAVITPVPGWDRQTPRHRVAAKSSPTAPSMTLTCSLSTPITAAEAVTAAA